MSSTMIFTRRIIWILFLLLVLSPESIGKIQPLPKLAIRLSCHEASRNDPTRRSTMKRFHSSSRGGASTVAVAKSMSATQMKVFNLLSGGVAGTIASCLTNPLEVIKTQLQSSSTSTRGELAAAAGHPLQIVRRILDRDGIPGFFRGLRATLVGIVPARSIYFYSYEQSKRSLSPMLREGGIGNALLSGLAAGLASNTVTNPIWLIKTRMQLLADSSAGQQTYLGYRDTISSIYRQEGIGGFYKGIFASYWGCAEGCIQFMLYEQIKARLLLAQRQTLARAEKVDDSLMVSTTITTKEELPRYVYFWSAAAAKAVAAVATYPHEVARTRLREQARNGVFKYHGMWQTLRLIAKEEGRTGLYAGMGVHLLKVVPNSAIMFLTYEVVNTWLGQYIVADK